MKPSYLGKCYICRKKGEIVACISWKTQKGSDGKLVIGSWRNFCEKCSKKYNIEENRLKRFKSAILIPKEYGNYAFCNKCNYYYPKTKFYQKECLICYQKQKQLEDTKNGRKM